MIGTDYGHTDQSSELEALRIFQEDGQVPSEVARKILDDNPSAFYGF
jgi:predicted TIM-barrel fold metal-dependent hydrolase